MLKQALALFPAPWLMAVAMGLFLFAFIVVTVRASSRRARPLQERLATLPLQED